jgi:hypothetical protein
MTTKREVLIKHYGHLWKYADKHMPGLFPHPYDIDPADIVIFITQFFSPYYQTGDYQDVLKTCMSMKGVSLSDEDFQTHYVAVRGMIHDLVSFIKSA